MTVVIGGFANSFNSTLHPVHTDSPRCVGNSHGPPGKMKHNIHEYTNSTEVSLITAVTNSWNSYFIHHNPRDNSVTAALNAYCPRCMGNTATMKHSNHCINNEWS